MIPLRSLACLLLLGAFAATARGSAVSGTELFTCWMDTLDHTNDFGLAVANDSTTAASVTVSSPSRTLDSATIPPGDVHVFRFAQGDRFAPQMLEGTRRGMLSYRISSDVPVTVYQFNTLLVSDLTRNHTHDASTVLPVESLGARYAISAWPEVTVQGAEQYGLIAIVGVAEDPTSVTVTPTAPVLAGDLPASPAGAPIALTLRRGEVVQLASGAAGSDFTGSVVRADRPIAVFGGTRCSQVPVGTNWCDHLEEQLYPTQAWGSDFIAPKTTLRGAIPDYWRVLAGRAGSVTLTPDPLGGGPHALAPGGFLEFRSTADVHVTATQPVQVTQYLAGSTYSGLMTGPGDPSLMLVVPTAQFDTDFLFYTPELFADDEVMLLAPTGAVVTLDAAVVDPTRFAPIGTTGMRKALVVVADGVHSVTCSAPCMAYPFGYDKDTSYIYYAGGKPDAIGSSITCDVVQAPPSPCSAGVVTLDASRSSGAPPLSYSWTSFTPGFTLDAPSSAVTTATVPASGARAAVTISNADDAVTCWVDVPPPPPPAPPPVVTCPARVTAQATSRDGAFVGVTASATATCPPVTVTNDRTAGGADASDAYPCGITSVRFTATDARGVTATCTTQVEVTFPRIPGEVSAPPWGVPLLVDRAPGNRASLRFRFEDFGDAMVSYSLYQGTIPRLGMRSYDHVPVACRFAPASSGPSQQQRTATLPAGNRYFLVSASTCGGEGTRGFRSDGIERPALATDCGP